MGIVCNDLKRTQRSWKKRQDLFQGELSLYAVTLVCREDKNAWRYHVKIKLIILDAEWLETWWLQRKKEKWSQLQVKQLIKTLLLKIACLTTSWSCALDHVIFNTWQQRRKLFFFTFNMVKPYLINNTILIYNPFCFYPKLKRMFTYSDSLLEWDLNTPVYLSWPLMAHFALQLFLFACYSRHGHCHVRKCGETKDLPRNTTLIYVLQPDWKVKLMCDCCLTNLCVCIWFDPQGMMIWKGGDWFLIAESLVCVTGWRRCLYGSQLKIILILYMYVFLLR